MCPIKIGLAGSVVLELCSEQYSSILTPCTENQLCTINDNPYLLLAPKSGEARAAVVPTPLEWYT